MKLLYFIPDLGDTYRLNTIVDTVQYRSNIERNNTGCIGPNRLSSLNETEVDTIQGSIRYRDIGPYCPSLLPIIFQHLFCIVRKGKNESKKSPVMAPLLEKNALKTGATAQKFK